MFFHLVVRRKLVKGDASCVYLKHLTKGSLWFPSRSWMQVTLTGAQVPGSGWGDLKCRPKAAALAATDFSTLYSGVFSLSLGKIPLISLFVQRQSQNSIPEWERSRNQSKAFPQTSESRVSSPVRATCWVPSQSRFPQPQRK